MMPGLGMALRACAPLPATTAWAIVTALLAGIVLGLIWAAAVRARRASLRTVWRNIESALPAGEPIRAAHEIWIGCMACGCRHAATERCPTLALGATRGRS